MSKFCSLSFKLPFIIILMAVLMLGFLLSSSIYFANKGITQSTYTGFQNTAEGYANLFDSILDAQIMVSVAYASSSNIRNFLIYKDDAYRRSGLVDLDLFVKRNEYIENIYILDTNGTIVLDRNNTLYGQSITQYRPNLWENLRMGEEYAFSKNLRLSPTTGELTLALGIEVLDFENRLIGYLIMVIQGAVIHQKYFAHVQLGKTGRIITVNDNSIVTMDTDPAEISKEAPSEYTRIIQSGSLEGQFRYEFNNHIRAGYYQKMTVQPWIVAYAMDEDEVYEINKSIVATSIVIGIISVIFMALVVFLFTRSIIKPLKIIVEEAKEIENGNLIMHRRKLNRKDELGELSHSFHNMKYKLIEVIETTLNNADKMSQAANSLAAGNKDLAHKAENTAANLEETASSMQEIASAITMATNNSVKGNEMMNDCKIAIENAAATVSNTVKSMNEVNNDSEKIKDIIKVIEGIAFQTNILVLNAAVEAARAGDQGKGFAVVASEVRSLAQNSQTSAKDITELINLVYEKINKANEIVESQEQLFVGIREQIEETANIIKDISSAALEQQSGVDQVNKAVMEMDSITQENAALVEESTASSISLYNDARELQNIVGFFKIEK
ncbi:methyl-accepting chemotaxis protein [Brachyspira murdochii]|uniref:Chemotaxis protein n=1 Tax=Brachyspira murdochii TaxID=84378 RepID=A0ABX5B7E1_9SPIR|nr:methyl-accepting chemotaxis protein [Brachyspira murdochii]PPS22067.1 chemotaxis protein [Brachyspira murdochii]